ncbi:hypothetical protein [Microbacterium sulfonylureivorans]|uniref:hypothetical protein n=1 Tax=Microbacterium sulfonylureivorans TaxID=2486854 RepID=UPI000FDCA947|nr:hypothetical protein [Microbacterium sulfonylureivorans]
MLPPLSRSATADDTREALAAAGWREIGSGDWAWVFASPDDSVVARVTPFDPAFRLFADACLAGLPNPYLVRVDEVVPLRHRGYVVVMERLHPADEGRAQRLAAALTVDAAAAPAPSADSTAALAADPDVVDLRRRIGELVAEGARRFLLWGGADIRPDNILQTADGGLRITDPVFVRGLDIFAAIRDGRADRLRDFSRADLHDFLSIPAFPPGPETDALREKADALTA